MVFDRERCEKEWCEKMNPGPARKTESDQSNVGNVIDLEHLDQYTLGDRGLQSELLQLFRIQLMNQTKSLVSCDTESNWKSGTHTLKGAARAVGAWQVCEVAEAMEQISFADEQGRVAILERLTAARTAFESHVGQYL